MELETDNAQIRKDKINKLLDINAYGNYDKDLVFIEGKPIDVFGDTEIVISIRQRVGVEDNRSLERGIDFIDLNIKLDDFADIDLDGKHAEDDVKEIFEEIIKENLKEFEY